MFILSQVLLKKFADALYYQKHMALIFVVQMQQHLVYLYKETANDADFSLI